MTEKLEFNTTDFENRETLFAEVALPLPLPLKYTYRVPYEFNDLITIGARVIVQFGKRKVMTAIVARLHNSPPEKYEAKPILDILDRDPTVNNLQMELFEWMAGYYMCTTGEVLNAALPSGLKLSSESRVYLHPDFDPENDGLEFAPNEQILIAFLETRESISYTDVQKLLGIKTIYKILKSLIDKNVIVVYEGVLERYKPKTEKRLRLADKFVENKEDLQQLLDALTPYPKQENIVLKYLQEVPILQDPLSNAGGLLKGAFKEAGCSQSSLKTLVKKGVLEEFKRTVPRFGPETETGDISLSPYQQEKTEEIHKGFEDNKVVLLHGVTGSGKTEIYINLIKDALDSGSQALLLLPEIALTTQIISRMKKVFGEQIGVYHSRAGDNERVEVWKGLMAGNLSFVVGVRSSVFLPFNRLGLIIVDEEHEPSYKQFDPAPRYHARDTAILMGQLHGARILLGSATPSLESYYNCKQGRYHLVELDRRFGGASLPTYKVINIKDERNKKRTKGHFSDILLEAVRKSVEKGRQTIVFQNKRGFSYFVRCDICEFVPKCNNCSVSLTYHQFQKELRCHYCGYREKVPDTCPACGSAKIVTIGFGTEKLEEDLSLLLPDARIRRMDMDTMKSKSSYNSLLDDFEKGNIDILVGTQMLSKGLDFDKVELVAIVDLDRQLHFPDFRSFERSFQLAVQVGGRAGRRSEQGTVFMQTVNPDQDIVRQIVSNDYKSFFLREAEERRKYGYPPFARLIKVTIRNKDKELSYQTARVLKQLYVGAIGPEKVLGPEPPLVSKIRNNYLMEIILKQERGGQNLRGLKETIKGLTEKVLLEKTHRSSSVVFNVDPV